MMPTNLRDIIIKNVPISNLFHPDNVSVIAMTLGYISDDDHEKIVSVIGLNCVSAEIQRIKKVLFSTCNKNTIDKIEYGLREAFI